MYTFLAICMYFGCILYNIYICIYNLIFCILFGVFCILELVYFVYYIERDFYICIYFAFCIHTDL